MNRLTALSIINHRDRILSILSLPTMDNEKVYNTTQEQEYVTDRSYDKETYGQDGKHLNGANPRPLDAVSKLMNPLSGVSKPQLFADVERFCQEKDLNDKVDIFQRGALIAQNPFTFEEIAELKEDDLFWLRKAHISKWSQPKMLYFTGESTSRRSGDPR